MRKRRHGKQMGPIVLGMILMGCAVGGRDEPPLPEGPASTRAAPSSEPRVPATPTPALAMRDRAAAPNADLGPTTVPAPRLRPTPEWLAAPELEADAWLNSEPLSLADLRGKVVIIEFWTYG